VDVVQTRVALRAQVTAKQSAALEGWAQDFLDTIDPTLATFLANVEIPIWHDFAGGGTPLWALEYLNVAVREVVCCEWAGGPQKWIFRNSSPEKFYGNIFLRDHASVDCKPGLMVGGFPCKAFSWLRCGNTDMLEDQAAKQFWEEVKTIQDCQ
jgi:hypothetical protein